MSRTLAAGLSRTVGAAAASTLALALLVCGCVFAAMAGPALSLHTRSQALTQTLGGLTTATKTVQASSDWVEFVNPTEEGNPPLLTSAQLSGTLDDIGHAFAGVGVPLGRATWAGLTSTLLPAAGLGPAAQADGTPKVEVIYRDPLAGQAQVVQGSYSGARVPPGVLQVAATTQTASRFGLHVGSQVILGSVSGPIKLYVTAILSERDPGSTFWTQDNLAAAPSLNVPPRGQPYWAGGLIAIPSQLTAMQAAFSGPGMTISWEYPVDANGLSADQAQGLYNALNRATTVVPQLPSSLAAGANGNLTITSPMLSDLQQFLDTQAAIETVLLLLFVSLIVVGAAVIMLAARMMVARRDAELAVLRARGASLRQVAAVMTRAALVVALPAAAVGAGLAVALIPGGTSPSALSWTLAAITLAAALAGPPLIAVWQYRRPTPAVNQAIITSAETGPPRRAWRRVVAEVTAVAATVAGLVVLRNQGVADNGGIDLYLALTPVLVAVPVVLIVLRLYPLVLRGLLAASARRPGATGFIALSSAARSSLTSVLPAFALALALSLATFAGMVSNAISRGEAAAAWQTTGADAVITTPPNTPPVSSAAIRAITAVRGVRTATAVWNTSWVTQDGQAVTVVAVDPAAYAALTAGTPFPSFDAAKLGRRAGGTLSPGATVPVLASPSAAALLGTGPAQLSSLEPMGPISVRVTGTLSGTPAQPGGGSFVVMPLETLPGAAGTPVPNMVLISGSAIDQAQLNALIPTVIPDSYATYRSTVLASLASSPLQHGAALVIVLTLATAAAFGLFIVILGLALGSPERELILARLTVMGHERPTGLLMAEALPAVLAAVVAGLVCAVVLPGTIGSSIDLSAFTGTGVPVQFQLDAVALGLPAVVILVLAVATLIAQSSGLRRRGVTGALRTD